MAHPLLKKSEHKRAEPKLGEPKLVHSDSAPEIVIAQEMKGERVADTLIRARQQLGQDLRSIAEVLCIRYSYLDAIERGQYENLPGPTYAVGFMRTYAEYLGLDGEQIVDRFKNEVEGLDNQTKLHFPTPAPEGKMPGGAVFLVAALLFAGAYGVWFYLSNQGESLGDLVAPVPEQLQEMVGGTASTLENSRTAAPAPAKPAAPAAPMAASPAPQAAPEPAPQQQAMTPPAEADDAAATADRDDGPAAPAAPAMTAPQATAPTTPAAAPHTPAGQAPASQNPGSQGTVVLHQPNPAPAEPAPAATQQATLPAPEATPEATPEPPVAEAPAATAPASEPFAIPAAPESGTPATAFLMNHEPTVYGEENADARIVLKASQDAWVQVRDREGNLLLTRVLRVGDSYRVPNQADLTLLTGNAGGLEIMLDGSPLPALGPVGAVRRNIPLDPEQLKNGAGRQP